MTPAQAAWLRKLRKRGDATPTETQWVAAGNCRERGWSRFAPDMPAGAYQITPEGLAALAEYEAKT